MNRILSKGSGQMMCISARTVAKRPWNSEPVVDPVKIETRGRVMLIMLNRPDSKNAVNRYMAEQLHATMRAFESMNPSTVSSAVLCSSSSDFCSGFDLHDVANHGLEEALEMLSSVKPDQSPMGPCKYKWNKPVIAAIEGACVAGGLELALCADLRVGTTDSYYGIYNRRFGIPLVDGGTYRLPRIVGQGHAMDMILTGRRVEADEANRIGLINRVVEPGKAIDAAVKLANEITTNPIVPMLTDRATLLENMNAKNIDEAIEREIRNGAKSLEAAFKSQSAHRFAKGQGRHGEK